MKRDNLVMICDVTEHILPSNSTKEGLINYHMLQNFHDQEISWIAGKMGRQKFSQIQFREWVYQIAQY